MSLEMQRIRLGFGTDTSQLLCDNFPREAQAGREAACPRSGPGEGAWGNREVPPAELGELRESLAARAARAA